jgi:hypothetical protein
MRTRVDATSSRRVTRSRRLLAARAGLCLIAFAAPAVAGAAPAGAVRGEAVVAAVLHSTAIARVVPERADLTPPATLKQHSSLSTLLPSALLVVLLLVLCSPRRAATGPSRQAFLLASAGPGPPARS